MCECVCVCNMCVCECEQERSDVGSRDGYRSHVSVSQSYISYDQSTMCVCINVSM